jgi:hypothetical protein
MKTCWEIWRTPLLMAILTLFGLLAALLGTGLWHWASWLAMATPIGIAFHYLRKR